MPAEYKIACHNTVSSDGAVLDNDKPAPAEYVAWMEKKSSMKAPEEAKEWKLSELNLFFLSEGSIRPSPTSTH